MRSGASVADVGAAAPAMLPALAMRGPNTPAPLRVFGGRLSPKKGVRVHGWVGGRREAVDDEEVVPDGYTVVLWL